MFVFFPFTAHLSPFPSCNHLPVKLRTLAVNQIFKIRSCFEGTPAFKPSRAHCSSSAVPVGNGSCWASRHWRGSFSSSDHNWRQSFISGETRISTLRTHLTSPWAKQVNIGVLPLNLATKALQVFWLFSLKFPFVSQLLLRNVPFCQLCRISRTWEVQHGWKNFPPWPPFFSWWFKISYMPDKWPRWAPFKNSKNKWLQLTRHIKLQMAVVFTQRKKRGPVCLKAGSGLCCEGSKPGWYVVGNIHRQTISVSLTRMTNVGISQVGNYWSIHIASREER